MKVCCGNCVKQDASLLRKLCQTRCTFTVKTMSKKMQVCCGNCVKQDASLLWKRHQTRCKFAVETMFQQQPNPSASIWVIRGHQFVIRTRSSGSKSCICFANSLQSKLIFTITSIRGATNNIFHKVSCLYVHASAMSASSSTCIFASCNSSFGDWMPSAGVFSPSNTAGNTRWGCISSDTSSIYTFRKVTRWFAVVWLFGWVGGSVRGCVSDPRFIQFALCGCYAVHINALSIELKCTSKGTTCKLN